MSDCPHIHIQDSGLQVFRDIIREETDGGRTIVRFLKGAMNREYSNYQPQHELEAAKTLVKYGSKEAELYVAANTAPKRPRTSGSSRSVPREPVQSEAEGDRDPIMAPLEDEMARFIREETDNGRTIVRTLIHTIKAREDPYKPHHNLAAAKQLIDNGFPITGDLICPPDCTHHSAPADGSAVSGSSAHPERSAAESKGQEEPFDKEAWDEALAKIKRLEEEGILTPDPNAPKVDMSIYMTATDEEIRPYAAEAAAKLREQIALRIERRKKWPEIEERRRKKLAQIYPSHSDDTPSDSDPPDP